MEAVIGCSSEKFHGFPIDVEVNIYGQGIPSIRTGIAFLDHMLEIMSRHGRFDIKVHCEGDLHIDDHHTVDEIAMNLGLAFRKALNNNPYKINRYGFFVLPMDEVLTTASIDIEAKHQSFIFDAVFQSEMLGDLKTDMVREFWSLFSQKLECNFIVKSEYGFNDHHIAEGMFKCISRAISEAIKIKEDVP
jgi:imidazoleglycerol-phosphate dehydratase